MPRPAPRVAPATTATCPSRAFIAPSSCVVSNSPRAQVVRGSVCGLSCKTHMTERVTIVGGGLAGSEAAWQLARRGVSVDLFEMRPVRQTPVHQTGDLAELVCSNSLRGNALDQAAGLLKEEMRRMGSLIIRVADEVRVPAGSALAVDRERFAAAVTEEVAALPGLTLVRAEAAEIPAGPAVVASGPLTSEALSRALE